MPAYKHPCPRCGNWIQRDIAACPFCGTADPFAPGRCQACRAVIEDPRWVACPKCGASLVAPAPAPSAASSPVPASAPAQVPVAPVPSAPAQVPVAPVPSAPAPVPAAPPVPTASPRCSGCGAPLVAGARFCQVCGTLAG